MSSSDHLAKKTVQNFFWQYGAFALGKGVIFINTVILTRLLEPADFGLLALGLLAVGYLEVFNDFGIKSAVIYRQEDPDRTANAAFTFNILVGVLLTVATLLAAPLIAGFFREDRLTSILQVLSFSFVLTSIGSIHEARIRKDLHFQRRMIPQIGKAIAKGVVSIGLALTGFGVWSLVWGQIAGEIVASLLYWVAYRWIPKPILDLALIGAILSYGVQIIAVGFIGQIHKNVDYLLIGRRLDPVQLGYYSIAFRLPELIVINLVTIVGQVVFPTFAKIQSDTQLLRNGFVATLRYVSTLVIPVGVGMYIITPEFVTVFFTDRWAAAIPVMRVLSLYAIVYSLGYNCGDVYKATGRPDILIKLGVFKILFAVPIFYLAAGHGIYFVALAQLVTTAVITVLSLVVASRILQTGSRLIIQSIMPPSVGAAIMFLGTMALQMTLNDTPALARMVMLVIIGMVLYGAVMWVTDKELLLQAVAIVRPRQIQKAEQSS